MNRREAEDLLPWYVAGALSREEMRGVQTFIDSGEISAEQIDRIRFVGEALRAAGAGTPGQDPAYLEHMLARSDRVLHGAAHGEAEAPLVVVREQSARGRAGWAEHWSMTPPPARTVLAVQFALLLGLAAALTVGASSEPQGTETTPAAPDVHYTLVFEPGLTEAQVRTVLLENHASIVSGPSNRGSYTISFDGGQPVRQAAERLAHSGLVSYLRPLQIP